MYTRKKIFKWCFSVWSSEKKKTYKTKEFLKIDIRFSLDL